MNSNNTREQFRTAFALSRAAYRDYVEVGPQTYRWYYVNVGAHYEAHSVVVREAASKAVCARLDPLLFSVRTRQRLRRLGCGRLVRL